jgi:hypothetical protein
MKQILLTHGFFAQVDDEDFDYLNQFKWHVHKGNRSQTSYARTKIKNIRYFMHNFIFDSKGIDHIDENGLNNQKSNLRKASCSENIRNRCKFNGEFSCRYKGVSKVRSKFRARIRFNHKLIHLGYFDNEIDAAKAYDIKAKELFGNFANINFKDL